MDTDFQPLTETALKEAIKLHKPLGIHATVTGKNNTYHVDVSKKAALVLANHGRHDLSFAMIDGYLVIDSI